MTQAIPIRRFTDAGTAAFKAYLARLRTGDSAPPPMHLLEDARHSEPAYPEVIAEARPFASRYDFARYADRLFEHEAPDAVFNDTHLWSWLSLYYFDQVCPVRNGARRPGRDYRHIPEPVFRLEHRHLLSGAFLVYTVYALKDDLAEFLLCTPLPKESKVYHDILSRQNLATNPAVITAARRLYFNTKTHSIKRGAYQKMKPGAWSRFITVIQQLELNYDLYSMTWKQVLELLPPEFDQWWA